MTKRASSVGELVVETLARRRSATVTRVFPSSAYAKAGDDYFLILWGRMRSPMTVNLPQEEGDSDVFTPGDAVALDPAGIGSGARRIETDGVAVFRSPLLGAKSAELPSPSDLSKGLGALKSLYDVSPHGPKMSSDSALKSFEKEVLVPFTLGSRMKVYQPETYFGLIGRGGGFTPSGDDFVSGFLATFNHFARVGGRREIRLPRRAVASRTVPESAVILINSSLGHVDEGLGRLIMASSGGRTGFFDELVETAHRGHTSGMDMSLGVLLAEGALSGEDVLRDCLRQISG